MRQPVNQPVLWPGRRHRRWFIGRTTAMALAGSVPGVLRLPAAVKERKFRAAIIGHTGAGNYGHGLDLIFAGRPNIEVVAVADADAEGRAKAESRTGAARPYADFREMLIQEKPDLVSIAPRWTNQHHAMGLATLRAGAHIFIEKPFTRTLTEADELLSVAQKAGLKIALAHQMRLAPSILFLKGQLDAGLIGDLLEIRAHGKQDQRAGGEDLMVLGVHLFDLMRCFVGDAQWCTARILQSGQAITSRHVRSATEDIGPVVGDELFAQFAFVSGVNGTFTSRKANQQTAGPWGMEIIGSKGAVRILADVCPRIFLRGESDWRAPQWKAVDGDPTASWSDAERSAQRANERVVNDWLDAIQSNREPVCSGVAGMKAVEMAHAVFAAGLSAQRVELPLKNRNHPLTEG